MLKMMISMNYDKIATEKRYSIDGIYATIDNLFSKLGLSRLERSQDGLIYHGNGNARDYGRFGRVVNTLKRQAWFMDNVDEWRLFDSDDAENPEDFNEEDLLLHYREKQKMGV